MDASFDGDHPTTVNGNLAKLPHALVPLLGRQQWCVWKWTRKTNCTWQKPPYIATDPDRHASSTDPATWCDYATALATLNTGRAEGLTYILTRDDPFGAADVDHCRDPATGSIAEWAQQWLDQATATYVELTPSGTGLRIWGGTTAEMPLHTNELLSNGGRIELFRRTSKPLTITGRQIGQWRSFGNIDALLERAAAWAKQHKASADKSTVASPVGLTGGAFSGLSIDDIEQMVREGAPPGANRSDLFHAIVGHYFACGWSEDQIAEHLERFPDGISDRYQAEDRLRREIARSLSKWKAHRTAQQPQFNAGGWSGSRHEAAAAAAPGPESSPNQASDPHVADPEPDPDEVEEEKQPPLQLPPMFCHGDPDPRPLTSWLVKDLLPSVSYGVLAGQWGSGKTFLVFELSACLMTGQPFIGHRVKRQCGVLYIAAESVGEVRKRLAALVQEKCGGMKRAPFRWYEAAPMLLGPNAAETLIAMATQAEASLRQEFGLALGLIVIDTVAASAGYGQQGAESDAAVASHIMRVLAQIATASSCVVLGVDHFGKNIETGTRGSSAKEANAELVLACLGERELSGRVVNTRLAIRKNRAGPQGQEYPFTLREVELGLDEDGDPITTMVVEWTDAGSNSRPGPTQVDPWAEGRQADTRQAMLLLKRVLMSMLVEKGVDLPSAPDGPMVRMIDRELVRNEFCARTAADGTDDQKRKTRWQRFTRATSRAQEKQLIGIREIQSVTYLWLLPCLPDEEF